LRRRNGAAAAVGGVTYSVALPPATGAETVQDAHGAETFLAPKAERTAFGEARIGAMAPGSDTHAAGAVPTAPMEEATTRGAGAACPAAAGDPEITMRSPRTRHADQPIRIRMRLTRRTLWTCRGKQENRI
jgi:hypothetical protein